MARKQLSILFTILCALFMLLNVSCTTPAGRTAGEVVDDGAITTQVKSALLADQSVSGLAVSVETFQGEVVLTGAVDNQAQASKAVEIARGVKGVKKVKNLLKIK